MLPSVEMTLPFVGEMKNRQRLAGGGYTFPLIAKGAMNGAPVRLGVWLRRTGNDNRNGNGWEDVSFAGFEWGGGGVK